MQVCFLLPHIKVAGGITVVLTYARELATLGHEVSLVVRMPRFLDRVRMSLAGARPQWFPDLPRSVRIRFVSDAGMRRAIRAYRGDAIIADSYVMAEHLIHSETSAKKFHIIQHDERLYHGDRARIEAVYASDLHKLVVASWLRDMFRTDFRKDSTVLLNTYDRNIFKVQDTLRPHDGRVRIALLDHLYAWKGAQEGIEVVREVQAKHSDVLLMGFSARRTDRAELFDEYYYGKTGRALAEIYARADIFLCPSWDEGFGLPSVEAMACGAALVTYDNGGSRDFAYDGKTALVAPHKDRAVLTQKLALLVADPALRERIAQHGREYVEHMSTWRMQAQLLADTLTHTV